VAVLIDPLRAYPHAGLAVEHWCHMAADGGFEELHAFAAGLGIPRSRFQGDHYDLPPWVRERAVAAGADEVPTVELLRRMAGPRGDRARRRLRERFLTARRDPSLAVLEGFHALKHALRFGGQVLTAVAPDADAVVALAAELAPDVADAVAERVARVPAELFAALAPRPPATGVLAIARRPAVDVAETLAGPGAVVLLEDPRGLGNVGACVRVAAAAGAAGVLTTGPADPWHPDALRGAAGLHYAVPVARVDAVPGGDRPLVALDPAGEPLGTLPDRPLLAFGSERRGLSDALLARACARVALPMRPGVSSLNLATAVAAVLYRSSGG
jgi:RNA methyltransferase, TrmH family